MMTCQIQYKAITIDQNLIRYAVTTTKHEKTLLLLNGLGASIELVEPLIKQIKQRRVIIFDMPGIGGSKARHLPIRLSGYAKFTQRFLDKLSIEKVDVMGVSWGGALAQQFVKDFPQRCEKLILAATGLSTFIIPSKFLALSKLFSPKRYRSHDYLAQVAPMIYGGQLSNNPEWIVENFKNAKAPTRRGYFHQLIACAGWASASWIRTIQHETLILAGREDPLIPISQPKLMAKWMPNARLEIIQDGHLFLLTDGGASTLLVNQFLQSCPEQ